MSVGPPVVEFDGESEGIIEPSMLHQVGQTSACVVISFFLECIQNVVSEVGGRISGHLSSEIGASPVYTLNWEGVTLSLAHPGVGAPLCAASLEELIAMGGRQFFACGSAGVLVPGVDLGEVLLVREALRDEGTSYQYLPPDEAARPSEALLGKARDWLLAKGIPFKEVKTWTTDAVYRETRSRMERRLRQGCEAVDMEASAFFAVAKFRQVDFAQLFYASDDLSGERWDSRDFLNRKDARMRLLRVTLDLAAATVSGSCPQKQSR